MLVFCTCEKREASLLAADLLPALLVVPAACTACFVTISCRNAFVPCHECGGSKRIDDMPKAYLHVSTGGLV